MSVSLLLLASPGAAQKGAYDGFYWVGEENTRGLGCLQHACNNGPVLGKQLHLTSLITPLGPLLLTILLDTTLLLDSLAFPFLHSFHYVSHLFRTGARSIYTFKFFASLVAF